MASLNTGKYALGKTVKLSRRLGPVPGFVAHGRGAGTGESENM